MNYNALWILSYSLVFIILLLSRCFVHIIPKICYLKLHKSTLVLIRVDKPNARKSDTANLFNRPERP